MALALAEATRPRAARVLALLPLALGALTLVLLWVYYPHDYEISDPSSYAKNADWVAHGRFVAQGALNPGVFQQRFGVFLPVALVYALFGTTPHTTDLVPLLATLALSFVVWFESSGRARWFGVFCLLTCQPLIANMMSLFPDSIVAAFMALSVLALSRRMDLGNARWHVMRASLGVLAWYAAMLTKENAWWVLPLWAGALVVDLVRGRRELLKWFHLPAVLLAATLGALYLWFCAHAYGDALARIHTVQGLTGKHAWAIRYDSQLTTRLTDGASHYFWRYYGALPLVALLGLVVLPAERRIWGIYAALTVLLFWFGSTSLTSYQPMPLMPRMSAPCIPGLCICAGFAFAWLSDHLLRSLDPRHGFVLTALIAATLLLAQLTDYVQSWKTPPDLAAMALVRREVKQHPNERYLILTAERRTDLYVRMSFGFEPPKNVTVIRAEGTRRAALADVDAVILFVDPRNQGPDRFRSLAPQFRRLGLPAAFQERGVAVYVTHAKTTVEALLAR